MCVERCACVYRGGADVRWETMIWYMEEGHDMVHGGRTVC